MSTVTVSSGNTVPDEQLLFANQLTLRRKRFDAIQQHLSALSQQSIYLSDANKTLLEVLLATGRSMYTCCLEVEDFITSYRYTTECGAKPVFFSLEERKHTSKGVMQEYANRLLAPLDFFELAQLNRSPELSKLSPNSTLLQVSEDVWMHQTFSFCCEKRVNDDGSRYNGDVSVSYFRGEQMFFDSQSLYVGKRVHG